MIRGFVFVGVPVYGVAARTIWPSVIMMLSWWFDDFVRMLGGYRVLFAVGESGHYRVGEL